jgi:hypothetical protein
MESVGSSTCSQQANTDHYSDPDKFCPHIPTYLLSRSRLIVVSHLRHDLPSLLLPSCFPTKLLHAVLFCLIHGTYPTCPILHLIKNVKLCVSFPWRQSVVAEVKSHSFLTDVIVGGERPKLNPRRFNPRKNTQYPLCWQCDSAHSPSACFGEKKNLWFLLGFKQTTMQPVS